MIAALTGLAICVIGAACASVGLAIEFRQLYGARRARAEAERIVSARAGVRSELSELYKQTHYRHNAHCPSCGRFARRIDAATTVCSRHGIQMRTVTGPISIVLVPRIA